MNNKLIHRRIVDMFLANVELNPENIAISFKNKTLSYQELKEYSLTVSSNISNSGLQAPKRIAIIAERCPALIAAMIGTSLAGSSFVVLDGAYPDERLKQLIGICVPDLILAASAGDDMRSRCQRIARETDVPLLSHREDGASPTHHQMARRDDPSEPAYYLFTSGSTGTPKCVAVSHAPLVHFIDWHVATAGISMDDRFSLVSGLSHDPVLRDIFTPLSVGARLEIPTQDIILAPGQLRKWFLEQQITIAHLTPSMGRLLLVQGRSGPRLQRLRRVFWGGEQLSLDVVRQLRELAPTAVQTNFYGCTETPQAVCFHDIDPASTASQLPIGRPVEGFELTIADETGLSAPVGTIGEVCVRSPFLSLGYVSEGRIVPASGSAVYRTGDFGAMDDAGVITLRGRQDDQVKIRGYRVDLGEINACVLSIEGVGSSVTMSIEDANGHHVETFIQPDGRQVLDEDRLRTLIADRVPSYMVPTRCHVLPGGLPLLPSGKVDRQALRKLSGQAAQGVQIGETEARTQEEAALIRQWAPIFPGKRITPGSTFKSLGGDSLSYVHASLAAEELLGALPTDWMNRSVAQLVGARRKSNRFWAAVDSTIAIRCVAIVMIVAYHFGICPPGDGLTGAFFLISGYVFGTLKLPPNLRNFEIAPSLAAMWRIFLPSLMFALLGCAIDVALGDGLPLQVLLFYADLIDYPSYARQGFAYVRHDIVFWYVDCLLQIIGFVALAGLLLKSVHKGAIELKWFALALLVLGLFSRFVLPLVVNPGIIAGGLDDLSFFQFASPSNLATFALGVGLNEWASKWGRSRVALLVMLYGLIDAPLYGISNGLAIAVTGLCILYVPSFPVPRFLSPAIREIAAAALYIYLSQFVFSGLADKLLGAQVPVVETIAGVLGGVLASRLWPYFEKGLSTLGRPFFRFLPQATRQS